jgi:DNA-binding NtrC family response regulator
MEDPTARITHEPQRVSFLRFADAARLELRVELEAGKVSERIEIRDGESFRIGSHKSCELVLTDSSVSRFHCRLLHDQKGWRVSDIDSRNGTRLHGIRVLDAYLPSTECVLQLGDSTVRIRELASAEQVELLERPTLGDLYGTSVPMRKLFAIVDRVARTDANVLIEGESGSGKELVAIEVVRRGPRANKPFVVVDCSAISPNLIESELFGHVRGAFTGADRDRVGAFEAASGGTVFLDEIGELPLDMQPKLLRALEAREIRRIGETESRKVDVRVVAATNRKLELEVNRGRFREDLYFRLSVLTLHVPPLRERAEDIGLLIQLFLTSLAAQDSAHLFTPDVIEDLKRHDWPGNVRELRNYVERAVVLQTTQPTAQNPGEPESTIPIDVNVSFREAKESLIALFEKRYVESLLNWAEGNISKASRKGQMDRMNLYRLIQRYGLREAKPFREGIMSDPPPADE